MVENRCAHAAGKEIVKFAQPWNRAVDHRDLGTEPCGHARSLRSHHPAAEHDDPCRLHAGNTAQQQPAAAGRAFERGAGSLYGKAAGDFAHRRKQGEVTGRVGDGFIGDRSTAGGEQTFGLFGIRREMEVSKQDLAFAKLGPFALLRLLHLHDHVGLREDVASALGNDGPCPPINLVRRADAAARAGLDRHLVPGGDIFADHARGEPDAIFLHLDLLGHTDTHPGLLLIHLLIVATGPVWFRANIR
ncbi:hypothetical protein ACVWWG_005979 [Bradyrhizobium sp. LB7.2]